MARCPVSIVRILILLVAMFSVIASIATIAKAAVPTSPFKNIGTLADSVGMNSASKAKPTHAIKIAILDNGFRGYQAELGGSLPATTVYHAGPVAIEAEQEETHGLYMAQLLAGLLTYAPQVSYELHLYSAYGYSNLKAAVEDVAAKQFDVVLYSQVWEYGGNGDGKGFINTLVNKATQAGVLWVNAAGNFADGTYRTAIEKGADDWAKLPGPNQAVRVRCTAAKNAKNAKNSKCNLRAVLSWNDFKDDVTQGTDKDLDLVLTDDTLKILRTSSLTQKKEFPEGQPGFSLYPREIIQAELTPGLYYLRVKMRSQNFSSQDELRLNVSGDFVNLVDATSGETLLPPADNATVITVGATDSERSSESRKFSKPEFSSPSLVTLQNGDQFKGTSNAAAITAAVVAIVKSVKPELDRAGMLKVLRLASSTPIPAGSQGRGLSLQALEFRPLSGWCFDLARLPYIPQPLVPILRSGAVTVSSDQGIKIFTSYDPFTAVAGAIRTRPNDMLIVSEQGFRVIPRWQQSQLDRSYWFEVVEQPLGQSVCGGRGPLPPQTGPVSAKPSVRLPDFTRWAR